eukprot:5105814-Pyramimonas_sp.AAC.1
MRPQKRTRARIKPARKCPGGSVLPSGVIAPRGRDICSEKKYLAKNGSSADLTLPLLLSVRRADNSI